MDYDGTNSTADASVNYSLQEYANDVVYTLAEACREHELPMPHIISESGRALTAHHALLLIKVIDVESQADRPVPELTEDDHPLLHEMLADYRDASRKTVSKRRVREIYHDLTFDKERAQELFNSGVFTLRERALAEQIYFATVNVLAKSRFAKGRRLRRHHRRPRRDARRPVLLQLLALPVAAGQLGDRPALPDHADSPPERGAGAPRHDPGRDV